MLSQWAGGQFASRLAVKSSRLASAQEAPGYNYRYMSGSVKRPPFWKRWFSRDRKLGIWGLLN